jgi:hypothetical protein
MTGLTLAQFDWVYQRCRPALTTYRLSLHQKNPNIPIMSPHNLLCIAIHWLRKGRTWRELELQYDRPHQWLNTMVHHVVPIIERSIFDELIRPIDPTSPPSTMSTLYDAYIIVDSTPIPLPKRPFLPSHYHKNSPTQQAWKVQIACDLSHRIVDLSHVVRGAEADVNLLLQSGLLEQSDEDHRIIGDKGYQGVYGIITPARRMKTKSQELRMLEDEKTQRHELETERAAIEQVNARVKQWAIFRGGYRGVFPDTRWIEPSIRAITALTQLLMLDAPLHKADTP